MSTQARHPSSDSLELFAAAALERPRARSVRHHLAACPSCREAARTLAEDMAHFRAVIFERTVQRVERAVAAVYPRLGPPRVRGAAW